MTVRVSGPRTGRARARFDARLLAQRAERLLAWLGRGDAELSLALVDDAEMARLNASWRGRSGPTDVLSFSLLEGAHAERRGDLLGDVVIDLEQALRQAEARGADLDAELARLLVHGVLHLIGHDHEEPDEARAMRGLERRGLAAILK
jgi:probable rRNA maturation factor